MYSTLRLCPSALLLLATLTSSILLTSCGSAVYRPMTETASAPSAPDAGMNQAMTEQRGADDGAASKSAATLAAEVPQSPPQLIKTANLSLTVDSIETALTQVKAIVQQQQGELFGLQDQAPTETNGRHTADIQLRLPQAKLEAALQALKALGTLQNQSITAEDVSTQLVDYQARLRNLRRSEATLLSIMERSGSVGDVLKVAQELSNVRNSIEQIDAQLKTLQNRVAYSTVNLSLAEAIQAFPPTVSVQTQLQEAWESATHSIGELTVNLLQLGIWLLVYSPYWALLLGGALLIHSRWRSRQSTATAPQSDPPAST